MGDKYPKGEHANTIDTGHGSSYSVVMVLYPINTIVSVLAIVALLVFIVR